MYSNLNLSAFIRQFLPPNRRKEGLIALLQTLFSGIGALFMACNTFERAALKEARATGQVAILQSYCSDIAGGAVTIIDAATADFCVLVPTDTSDAAIAVIADYINRHKLTGKSFIIEKI